MISIQKSIIAILAIAILSSIAATQGSTKQRQPFLMLTEDSHQPIFNIDDIAKYAEKLTDLKAITVNGQSLDDVLEQLRQLVDDLNIDKEQISSLIGDKTQIESVSNLKFDDISSVQQLRKIMNQHKNVVVHIDEPKLKGRTLAHDDKKQQHQQEKEDQEDREPILISDGDFTYTGATNSKLFLNMTPATLSGLLVSLFLIIVLIIAINCLYNVKTNDSFAKNNLWVGKQS